jgi:hypothetical protein
VLVAAAALKTLSVSFTVLGAAVGKSPLALLLSPTGVLVLGLGALAAAFVHARTTGQTWFDSIAEGTARLLGFENAVTAANLAIGEANASKARTRQARTILDTNEQRRLKGEQTAETLQKDIAEFEGLRDKSKADAKRLLAESRLAMDRAAEKRSSFFGSYTAPGDAAYAEEASQAAQRKAQEAAAFQRRIDALKLQLQNVQAMDAYRATVTPPPAPPTPEDTAAAQTAVANAATGAWTWLRGLGGGLADIAGKTLSETGKELLRASGERKARPQGGELSDMTNFLAGMQQQMMDAREKKLQADIEANTAETATATSKVPDLLSGIRSAINGLKFGFGV